MRESFEVPGVFCIWSGWGQGISSNVFAIFMMSEPDNFGQFGWPARCNQCVGRALPDYKAAVSK